MSRTQQYYKIAGLTVAMSSFGRNEKQAIPFLCEEDTPDITIQTDWRQLQKEQPHLSDEDCEYLCAGSSFYTQLLNFDGMMLHASAVVVDNKAYLFTAHSGTGKSTHTSLWLRLFGSRAYILNDDKPALRFEDGAWFAYGTPWSGKYDISVNARVPLAGICHLRRDKTNSIAPFAGPKAIFALLEQTCRPATPGSREKLLELLDKLLTHVPVWQMGCNMEPEAAVVSYEAMSGKTYRGEGI